MQLEDRISQHVGDTEVGQRRSNGAQEHLLGSAARDDEPADAHPFTDLHPHPGREVDRLCRRTRRWRRTW